MVLFMRNGKGFFQKILACFFLSIFLMACSSEKNKSSLQNWMQKDNKIKLLATTQMIGDLVKEIGGIRTDCHVLIKGELDPHNYELVKGDDEKLARADFIFYNGLGLEHGASLFHFLKNTDKASAMGEKIAEIFPDRILKLNKAVDPHIWMDVDLWAKGTAVIVEELANLDPEGKEFYQRNGELLCERLKKTHEYILKLMREIPLNERYLVTSHDAFNYYAKAYLAEDDAWQEHFTAPEGLAPEGQLSPLDIKRIIDYVDKHQVRFLFPESNVSKDSLQKIAHSAKKMGLKLEIAKAVLYGDAGIEAGDDEMGYLKMMEHNACTIHHYLKEKK
jgi:manganese/zinc/iron transport system substrate-binding protein